MKMEANDKLKAKAVNWMIKFAFPPYCRRYRLPFDETQDEGTGNEINYNFLTIFLSAFLVIVFGIHKIFTLIKKAQNVVTHNEIIEIEWFQEKLDVEPLESEYLEYEVASEANYPEPQPVPEPTLEPMPELMPEPVPEPEPIPVAHEPVIELPRTRFRCTRRATPRLM